MVFGEETEEDLEKKKDTGTPAVLNMGRVARRGDVDCGCNSGYHAREWSPRLVTMRYITVDKTTSL